MKVSADGYFAIMPEWLIDSDVSDKALRVYAVLARYADQRGHARPSRQTLAERCHCSRDSVDRAMKELEEVGAVKVVRRVENNVYMTNEYVVQRLRGSRTDAARGRGTRAA